MLILTLPWQTCYAMHCHTNKSFAASLTRICYPVSISITWGGPCGQLGKMSAQANYFKPCDSTALGYAADVNGIYVVEADTAVQFMHDVGKLNTAEGALHLLAAVLSQQHASLDAVAATEVNGLQVCVPVVPQLLCVVQPGQFLVMITVDHEVNVFAVTLDRSTSHDNTPEDNMSDGNNMQSSIMWANTYKLCQQVLFCQGSCSFVHSSQNKATLITTCKCMQADVDYIRFCIRSVLAGMRSTVDGSCAWSVHLLIE